MVKILANDQILDECTRCFEKTVIASDLLYISTNGYIVGYISKRYLRKTVQLNVMKPKRIVGYIIIAVLIVGMIAIFTLLPSVIAFSSMGIGIVILVLFIITIFFLLRWCFR